MKETAIRDLEAQRSRALRPLRLPDLIASEDAPEFVRQLDPEFVTGLLRVTDLPWGDEGLYPEAASLLREIRSSEEGLRLCLEADIEHLQKVGESGEEQLFRGPLDFVEGAFPVRVRGVTIHCLWSGKMRDRPFSSEEKKTLARLIRRTPDEIEALLATVPILTKAQVERTLTFCRRVHDALEQAVESHLRAMECTRQLVQSERALSLGTLSGGVAHHFNNLLSVILGYSSFVLNREKLSREATDALRRITDAAQRGRRLTEEILAFLGNDSEQVKPCAVHQTLRQVLSLLESQTGASIRISTALEAQQDNVLSAPSSIRQIVFNLLTQAMDSLPAGGRVEMSTANAQIQGRPYLQLEVVDRAEEAGGPPAAGRRRQSLKLSSLYGMVRRLEGSVVFTEEAGGGHRLRVLLPVLPSEKPAQPARRVRGRPAPSTIWLVDDDPIFREMCRQVLSDGGHDVLELDSGRAFRERWRARGGHPDLIILDYSMPEDNGRQLCEELRAEGSRVPIILVSGFAANQPDISRALRMKRTYFLQKPFSFREMVDVVTVALGETLIGE